MVMATMRQKWSLSKEDLYIKLQNKIKQIKDEIYQSFFNYIGRSACCVVCCINTCVKCNAFQHCNVFM